MNALSRMALTLTVGAALPAPAARADAAADLLEKGERICAATTLAPEIDFEATFAPVVRAIVTPAELERYLAGFAREYGACSKSSLVEANLLRFDTDAGGAILVSLHVDEAGLVDGFRIVDADDPRLHLETPAALAAALEALGGQTSLHLSLDGAPGAAASVADEEPLAIGSTFKLWILGTLWTTIPSTFSWTTPLAIREDWKSLPSGEMHLWPAGSQAGVFEYARKMIADSDNTATDHLLHYLGRDAVAAHARVMGLDNADPGNAPFLSTVEAFKLKWLEDDATRATRYVFGTLAERNAILAELATKPREAICIEPRCFLTPKLIDTIEWFASTRETCAAMRWLTARGDAHLVEILGANTPFVAPGREGSHWAWAGYKGGSEPGVIHMTYGLRSRAGAAGCLALAWNDPTHDAYAGAAREMKFFALAGEALRLAEGVIP